MKDYSSFGISLVEILIILALVAILAWLAVPSVGVGLVKEEKTQTLSNMKQLHLATQQMALDRETTDNTRIGWPGDSGGSFTNWAHQLLDGGYLSRADLCKLLSAPGIIVSTNNPLTNNSSALLVYATSTNSPFDTVFLSTANFTNTPSGGVFNPKAQPYRNKGFVVFRAAGDGAILQPRQVGMTNVIGSYVPLCH